MFISFEGVDRSGKSTQVERLAATLRGDGREVVVTREPGGTELGELVRELVLKGPPMTPFAEAALFAASRAEHVAELIEPALERGAAVLCDRFVDSSLAYQGAGRQLGIEEVRAINEFATEGLAADRTLLLLLEPAVGLSRASSRPGPADRLEREHEAFFERIASSYAELAASDPGRIRVLDAALPAPTVLANAVGQLADLLP